jgi:hypothetical protein
MYTGWKNDIETIINRMNPLREANIVNQSPLTLNDAIETLKNRLNIFQLPKIQSVYWLYDNSGIISWEKFEDIDDALKSCRLFLDKCRLIEGPFFHIVDVVREQNRLYDIKQSTHWVIQIDDRRKIIDAEKQEDVLMMINRTNSTNSKILYGPCSFSQAEKFLRENFNHPLLKQFDL